ncbi:uncharacterized protein LOC133178720 [Saccostrea echinata]|uniref:uncharacterized protein LOC133178720 n=1 Tax=Saccostrea echinata TaxID=191078 RepID=UPI002A8117E0|nr:uncharacterized protein LOC133178720 [Saccostrea echinata]
MDTSYCAQDILRCDLCDSELQSHCELCHINLCRACVGDHLSDSSKKHRVVPYSERRSTLNYPKCPHHDDKCCELYCEICDSTVCSTCISSGKHKGHNLVDVRQKLSSKKEDLEKDLKELEENIYPKYTEIATDIHKDEADFEEYYGKQITAVITQGEEWHKEVENIVNKEKSSIEEMKTKHLTAINKEKDSITQTVSHLQKNILELKNILKSNDFSLAFEYKSRNAEFRRLPPKLKISLPSFCPRMTSTEQLRQQFGSLSALFISEEDRGWIMRKPEGSLSPPVKPLLSQPQLLASIDTGYPLQKNQYSVTCLSDELIWTSGEDRILKLYNLQGSLLKLFQTGQGSDPEDITITRNGDLVFTDPNQTTVNIVKNDRLWEMIRVDQWKIWGICKTYLGELLVTMDRANESKVVRFSGSTKIQSIQFDEGNALYLPGTAKYISENRNFDICVTENIHSRVVVVNQAGKLRFRYTGHRSVFPMNRTFDPIGITTDSQSHILVADCKNCCIHILNQDGKFLRFINNCYLTRPWGICVNTSDKLFVADGKTIKKILYI